MLGKLSPIMYGSTIKKKNRRKETPLICKECGEEFYVYRYEKDRRKFCSRTCASRNFNRTRKIDRGTRICEYCGKEYKLTHVNKNTRYCSRKCSAIHRCEKQMHDREVLAYE